MVDGLLLQVFTFLGAAIISVPLAKRLGLGSVVGYLLAGAVIGPFGLRLLGVPVSDIMHFAEFGVVLMLFLIGLEMAPKRLWALRQQIFGVGLSQTLITAAVLFALCHWLIGWSATLSVVVSLSLALSSTAVGIQTLEERGELQSPAGRSSFSVLLFQDIAVIPILAIFPLLASTSSLASDGEPTWLAITKLAGMVAVIVVGGRTLLKPLLRIIARTRLRELFTGLALLLVIGAALAMQWVGISPALGAFLAGVVLADSEYRHELESDLEPFKGLLLGVFFMSVGASVDFNLLADNVGNLTLAVIGLMVLKGVILFALGKITRMTTRQCVRFAVSLAQGSEFAFVLLGFAAGLSLVDAAIRDMVVATVAISMFLTPLVWLLAEWIMQKAETSSSQQSKASAEQLAEEMPQKPVIIAGFGRFGQIVGRMLISNGIAVNLLDQDPDHIDMLNGFGFNVFYGDATRLDLLHAAGADDAELLVIAIDDRDKITKLVTLARRQFPELKLLVRAIDRRHVYELRDIGVYETYRETFGSALELGKDALRALGYRHREALNAMHRFRSRDLDDIDELYKLWQDRAAYRSRARAMNQQLHALIEDDREQPGVDPMWSEQERTGDDGGRSPE